MKKIYESPDKGKTIYERNFGDYNNRTLIKAPTKMPRNTEAKSISVWMGENFWVDER